MKKYLLHIIGIVGLFTLLATLSGCGKLLEKAIEKGLESETGQKVDVDLGGQGLSLTGEKGEKLNFQAGQDGQGVFSFTDEKGKSGVLRVDESGFTGATEKGSFQVSQKLPAHFPSDIPLYQPSKVLSGTESLEPDGSLKDLFVMMMSADDASDAAAFYRKELPKNGWTIANENSFGPMVIFSAAKKTGDGAWILSISVSANPEGNAQEKTGIQIQLGKAKIINERN